MDKLTLYIYLKIREERRRERRRALLSRNMGMRNKFKKV